MNFPEFETDRLYLRPISMDMVVDYKKYFIDYEVIRHLSAVVPWPYPETGVAEFLQTVILPSQGRDRWTWGIFLKSYDSELIGCVDLWRKGTPENRGFWLGKPFWGKGIMTEAVKPVMDYAFESLGFEKLLFSNALGNLRSRRIKEKTGAKLLGIRESKFVDPTLTFAETWELTKEDWIRRSSKV
jgi:ribosomal-protein-alanine N-acetyltransferase